MPRRRPAGGGPADPGLQGAFGSRRPAKARVGRSLRAVLCWACVPPGASVLAVALAHDPFQALARSAFRDAIERAPLSYYAACGALALVGGLIARPRLSEVAIGVTGSIVLAVVATGTNLLPFALLFEAPAIALALGGAATGGCLRGWRALGR